MTQENTKNTRFTNLSDHELTEIQGGIGVVAGSLIVAGLLTSFGVFNGCSDERARRGK